jgi:hypothetical protein
MDDRSKMMKMEYQPQQKIAHILTPDQAASLLQYVELKLQYHTCRHDHRFTQEWLEQNISFMQHDAILNELEDMGGYCDCEVLRSCYEDYEL